MTNPNQNPSEGDSLTSYSRRKALTAAAALGITAAATTSGLAQKRRTRPIELRRRHPAEVGDFRFRKSLLRAASILHKRGKLDKKEFARIKSAAWSGLPIAIKGEPGEPERLGTFIRHLKREVAAIIPDKRVAGGLLFGDEDDPGIFDSLFEMFDFQELFNSLTNWLIENWPDVLKMIITLLIFLEAAEAETD